MQALPGHGLLLHVGPQKTGTTAIQSSLAASRAVLREQGIVYPGRFTHNGRAALAGMGRRWGNWKGSKGARAPRADWDALLAELGSAPGRTVVSSEFFGEAPVEVANQVVDDLGRERVHVVVTLRSLARVLPSSWQQFLKSGHDFGYEQWLDDVLANPPESTLTKAFWQRQDHGALVQRWVSVVGRDRVTVLVLDDDDRNLLFSSFEALLGVEQGTLRRPPGDRANRSLSAVECDVLRRINVEADRANVPWRAYTSVVRYGAFARMIRAREPAADEPRIVTPAWAYDRAAELGAAAVQQIRSEGVEVIGELATLTERPAAPDPEDRALAMPSEAAAELVLGALSASMGRGAAFGAQVEPWPPAKAVDPLAGLSTTTLAKVVGRRSAQNVRRQTRRVGRRLKRRGD